MKPTGALTVAVSGSPVCGKSTIVGHLLSKRLLSLDDACVEELELEAAELTERSSKFAKILRNCKGDTRADHSKLCKLRSIPGSRRPVFLVDTRLNEPCPKATLSSLIAADALMLSVDAVEGVFEESIGQGGAVRDIALQAYALGIQSVVVAINKLDAIAVPYSEARFLQCAAALTRYLTRVGYPSECIFCIPVSGLKGDNLTDRSSAITWYRGPTLWEALDALTPQDEPDHKPLRAALHNVVHIGGKLIYTGHVECGTLRPGMTVTFTPPGLCTNVKAIEVEDAIVETATRGDVVSFTVTTDKTGGIGLGCVVSETRDEFARSATSFVGKLTLMGDIKPGVELQVNLSSTSVRARLEELLHLVDRRSGKVIEGRPCSATCGDTLICKFRPLQDVAMEACSEHPMLSRFCAWDENKLVGVGLVTSVDCKEFALAR